MLRTARNERVIMVDIDDTLVMHGAERGRWDFTYVDIEDHVDKTKTINLRVNEPMVRLVIEEIARGSQVIFWSKGGFAWAENVLKALKLNNMIGEQIVLTKPTAYFDDKTIDSWLKDRVYLDPDTRYKK